MKRKKGFGLIEILIVVVIIGFLYYTMMNISMNNSSISKELAKEGINTSDLPGMINTAKDKVNQINQKIKEQENQWENIE